MARRNVRDSFFLFYGIIMGAVMGFFGSIYASWYYDTYKTESWFLLIPFISMAIFVLILLYSAYKMVHWWRILNQEN